MLREEMPSRLAELLRSHGADPSRPTPRQAWRAFVDFLAEPVTDADPFQHFNAEGGCDALEPSLPSRLFLAFQRSMPVSEEDDYVGTWVFDCDFSFDGACDPVAHPRLTIWNEDLWPPDPAREIRDFVAAVNQHPEFLALLDSPLPYRVSITANWA
jgi:hypothetical protein